jgi:hypothetical protein
MSFFLSPFLQAQVLTHRAPQRALRELVTRVECRPLEPGRTPMRLCRLQKKMGHVSSPPRAKPESIPKTTTSARVSARCILSSSNVPAPTQSARAESDHAVCEREQAERGWLLRSSKSIEGATNPQFASGAFGYFSRSPPHSQHCEWEHRPKKVRHDQLRLDNGHDRNLIDSLASHGDALLAARLRLRRRTPIVSRRSRCPFLRTTVLCLRSLNTVHLRPTHCNGASSGAV